MQKFGLHISVAGGIDKAPKRAKALGCDTFQIFISNPRSWKEPNITPEMATDFKAQRIALALGPVTVHATYLPNLANPDTESYKKALEHIKLQYQASKDIGADFFVFHPGSHKKSGVKTGISQISKALQQITSEIPAGPIWLLENTAGAGDSIGRDAAELIALHKACKLKNDQIGICLDTCHAFASGINISNSNELSSYCKSLEDCLYSGAIRLIHMNDSKFECNSNKDRHEHIGLGKISVSGIRNILHSKYTQDIPIILETPINEERDDLGNLQAARDYCK